MSLGSIQDIIAVQPGTLTNEPESSRAGSTGQSFSDLLDASVTAAGEKNEGSKQAAKTAEILQLEMMRSALSIDGSPTASSTLGSGMLNSMLAAYGAVKQNAPMSPSESAPGVSEVQNNTTPVESTVSQSISNEGGYSNIASLISKASRRYGVDEGLIRAVIQTESNFKPTAVSPAGAQGLMQLMPATAAGLGVSNPFDPEQNVMAGTKFLKDLLNKYGGNVDKALAAYNWGPGNLDRGRGALPRETQNYLVKVKKLYSDYGVG